MAIFQLFVLVTLALCHGALGILNATESSTQLTLQNERLFAAVNKSNGAITSLILDGQNLLGKQGGSSGIGPYLDCYCIPSGFYTPGLIAPEFKLFQGVDSTNTKYGGIMMGEVYPPTGQRLEQYWFLREKETGLHTFSRLAYHNEAKPFLRNLQEFRTMFRPNSPLWTHLSTEDDFYGPLPSTSGSPMVQDATWYLQNRNQPYVTQIADYFTKYTFQTTWQDHKVHGMYSDGSTSSDGSTYGAWLVMNTIETYFGGPLHSDLVVDGIVYNYMVSNHHGDGTPNITDGFDRTFGPQYFHFNKGAPETSLAELRADAAQYADPAWNVPFYDSIAKHVPNYIPTSERGNFSATILLPAGAKDPIAVLAQNHVDFQDNVEDTTAYQYWAPIDPQTGFVSIPRAKTGLYRLTVYATGIFGNFIVEDVPIGAEKNTLAQLEWEEESAGTELWRIGIPDKSSGEYRHGYEREPSRSLHPEQYRVYWGAYDFPTDYPEGVRFKVGEDDPGKALNYVHWSVYGGKGNHNRSQPYWQNVNNWTILFDVEQSSLDRLAEGIATLTVQLAGAKTAAGNTDIFNSSEPYANLPYTVNVNGRDLEPWIIPLFRYYQSSSCAVRSAVICYNLAHKFEFEVSMLKVGHNELVLSLPANATNHESAVLPESVYVQYDALRLEVQ
ncbi:polysaccharide lyase family 4 protein [Patellaria atrata CBS 101060]|uniref:Polysaccharide lyase family 4 protein n=1 Tax=Patellaria atrata CBS 101060 TaxID=1346257 RepID=A0A9P4VKM8_9PEZI|nr:polysaccharide lyase family 4 protein [Patellaria atrata CBS 101060]